MMPIVYAMCGLAFSGKSTAARLVAHELGAELISLDAINHERGLRGGDGIPDPEWERTSLIAMERLRACLGRGRSAVVDDTFSHRFLRDRCRGAAEDRGCGFVILFVDTSLEVIAARRRANDRNPTRHRVRDEVFAEHCARFEFPAPDEPFIRFGGEADLRAWLAREKDGPPGA
jgi:predicted kinase